MTAQPIAQEGNAMRSWKPHWNVKLIDSCCFLGFGVVNMTKMCNKVKDTEEKDLQNHRDFEILILPVNKTDMEVNL